MTDHSQTATGLNTLQRRWRKDGKNKKIHTPYKDKLRNGQVDCMQASTLGFPQEWLEVGDL